MGENFSIQLTFSSVFVYRNDILMGLFLLSLIYGHVTSTE